MPGIRTATTFYGLGSSVNSGAVAVAHHSAVGTQSRNNAILVLNVRVAHHHFHLIPRNVWVHGVAHYAIRNRELLVYKCSQSITALSRQALIQLVTAFGRGISTQGERRQPIVGITRHIRRQLSQLSYTLRIVAKSSVNCGLARAKLYGNASHILLPAAYQRHKHHSEYGKQSNWCNHTISFWVYRLCLFWVNVSAYMLPKNADKNLFFCYSRNLYYCFSIFIIVFQSFFSTTTFIVVCKAVLPHRDSHCSSSLTGRGQCRMTRLLQLGSPLRPLLSDLRLPLAAMLRLEYHTGG